MTTKLLVMYIKNRNTALYDGFFIGGKKWVCL